jgi:hypothetical protein
MREIFEPLKFLIRELHDEMVKLTQGLRFERVRFVVAAREGRRDLEKG